MTGRTVSWRYVGHLDSPAAIRLGGKTVYKGETVALPEAYDWTAEYGSDLRAGLRFERVSPPLDALTPVERPRRRGRATSSPTGSAPSSDDRVTSTPFGG